MQRHQLGRSVEPVRSPAFCLTPAQCGIPAFVQGRAVSKRLECGERTMLSVDWPALPASKWADDAAIRTPELDGIPACRYSTGAVPTAKHDQSVDARHRRGAETRRQGSRRWECSQDTFSIFRRSSAVLPPGVLLGPNTAHSVGSGKAADSPGDDFRGSASVHTHPQAASLFCDLRSAGPAQWSSRSDVTFLCHSWFVL